MALGKFIVFKKFLVWQSSLGQQHRLPAPEHCISTLVFPSVCGPFCCFFSSSLLCRYQLSSRAASTSAGSGLPPLSLLVLQHQVDVHLVRCVQFSPALMFRVRCFGSILGSGGSRSPCSRVPPFSKHLEKGSLWVVPVSTVAMDTFPLANGFCSPLTF